jgi:hypothetical protein
MTWSMMKLKAQLIVSILFSLVAADFVGAQMPPIQKNATT